MSSVAAVHDLRRFDSDAYDVIRRAFGARYMRRCPDRPHDESRRATWEQLRLELTAEDFAHAEIIDAINAFRRRKDLADLGKATLAMLRAPKLQRAMEIVRAAKLRLDELDELGFEPERVPSA